MNEPSCFLGVVILGRVSDTDKLNQATHEECYDRHKVQSKDEYRNRNLTVPYGICTKSGKYCR